MITILLTVSRLDYLEKVITAIELLECNKNNTNFLCIVDGNNELYIRARNLVNGTKFAERLTVRADLDDNRTILDVNNRRQRITAIHNQARKMINHNDGYVLSVEDDTTFKPDALKKLLYTSNKAKAVGICQGVELGRWGVPYVGAWLANDVYNLNELKSVENIYPVPIGQPPTSIDAGGLYFTLIKTDIYKQHFFACDNGLGPDINLGIETRQLGYEHYIVWQVPCSHHYKNIKQDAKISPSDKSTVVTLVNIKNSWKVSY